MVAVATAFGKAVNAPVQAAVSTGVLPVRAAAVVVAEYDRLQPLLGEHAQAPVLETMIETAAEHGPSACRRVRPFLLATYGRDGALQEQQDAARRFAALSAPATADGSAPGLELFEYRLTLDVEAKEVLEAAIGPLSAPRPSASEPDLRPFQQRRADALIEVIHRAVAAGESVPTTAKAQLFITVDFRQPRGRAARSGLHSRGDERGHATRTREPVRRLACDASIIPVVLGADSQVLDWGTARRLFTSAQTKRLLRLRDGCCTYPGLRCTDRTGRRDITSSTGQTVVKPTCPTLPCSARRHHTIVHTRRLAGVVTSDAEGERVEWDLTSGSYGAPLSRSSGRRVPSVTPLHTRSTTGRVTLTRSPGPSRPVASPRRLAASPPRRLAASPPRLASPRAVVSPRGGCRQPARGETDGARGEARRGGEAARRDSEARRGDSHGTDRASA